MPIIRELSVASSLVGKRSLIFLYPPLLVEEGSRVVIFCISLCKCLLQATPPATIKVLILYFSTAFLVLETKH